jgi:hypothetical protein
MRHMIFLAPIGGREAADVVSVRPCWRAGFLARFRRRPFEHGGRRRAGTQEHGMRAPATGACATCEAALEGERANRRH